VVTPKRLAKRLSDEGRSYAWLGKKLGVTRQTVGIWLRGEEPCPVARQAQINVILEITAKEPGYFDSRGYAL
jgi:hypothetical protein